jgi:hypothetical protein
MKSDRMLKRLLDRSVKERGSGAVKKCLRQLLAEENRNRLTLTIIANESLHKVPDKHRHGEVFVASRGNLDFTSQKAVLSSLRVVLTKLKNVLVRKSWKKVYLVPTGHPVLALQIKNLVYHVLRFDTVDLFYSGGQYYEIEIKRADFL